MADDGNGVAEPRTTSFFVYDNFMEAKELVELLSPQRADNCDDWLNVGLCLYTIDSNLLTVWIEFSKKAPTQFKEGICEKKWHEFPHIDKTFSIVCLRRWAELDNSIKYAELFQKNLINWINESQSNTTYDIAKVVHYMYMGRFIYTSAKRGNFYTFKNHRWILTDKGVDLRKKMSNQVAKKYVDLISYYTRKSFDYEDGSDEHDHCLQVVKNLNAVTCKLRKCTFKSKIMDELKILFYDNDFVNKLDTNPDLIGFKNGVYDLRKGEFRAGLPEDYISLSTEHNYIEFRDDDPNIVAVMNFMNQIFTDPSVREYAFISLSSFLEGHNPNEICYIWKGTGEGNGKSKLLELFELAFGQYTAKIPTTILNRKSRIHSASPEIARLKGIRLISNQDQYQTVCLDYSILKELTCNGKLTCRLPYEDYFDFVSQFKAIICCNQIHPLLPDDDKVWEKVIIIPFNSRFVDNPDPNNPNNPNEFQKDVHLNEKFIVWAEPFMFLLLQYYKVYKKTRGTSSSPSATVRSTSPLNPQWGLRPP
jgi:phage/plasmid-associated DNA primase